MKNILIAFALILGVTATGFAQSDKMKEKAMEKVEELNKEVSTTNASLALTKEQREKVYTLYLESFKAVKKVKKEDGDKDDKKEARKEFLKQIYGDVLTKEQKKARRDYKKSLKDN